MTQDEIIRMATEVWGYADWKGAPLERLERFAALVAAHEREKCFDAAMKAAEKAVDTAMLLEREACAKVCDELKATYELDGLNGTKSYHEAAAVIRARGELRGEENV